jgi:polyhydroxybutyrate depolymerase
MSPTRLAACLLALLLGAMLPAQAASLSPGCGRLPPAGPPGTFVVGDVVRRAILVLPAGYRPDQPLPLVVAFHGRTNDNARLRRYLALEQAARTPTIFLYPAARRDRDGFTWAAPDGSGPDLALFDQLTAAVGQAYCIDRARLFLVGHSLGASYANSLACARAAAIAGLATVAGGIGLEHCSGRVRALLLHNASDELVPLAQGARARDVLFGSPLAASWPVNAILRGFACQRGGGGPPLLWCLHRQNLTPTGRYYPHQWPQGASELIMALFAGAEPW